MNRYSLLLLLFPIIVLSPLYCKEASSTKTTTTKEQKKKKKEDEHDSGHTEEEVENVGIEEDAGEREEEVEVSSFEEIIAILRDEKKKKKKNQNKVKTEQDSKNPLLSTNKQLHEGIVCLLKSLNISCAKQEEEKEGQGYGKERLEHIIHQFTAKEFDSTLAKIHQEYLENIEDIQEITNSKLFSHKSIDVINTIILSQREGREEELIEGIEQIIHEHKETPFGKILQECFEYNHSNVEESINFLRVKLPSLVDRYASQESEAADQWKELKDLIREFSLKYELQAFLEDEILTYFIDEDIEQLALLLKLREKLLKHRALPLSFHHRIQKSFDDYFKYLVYQYNSLYLLRLVHEDVDPKNAVEKKFVDLFIE